jgi:hypothetical protein
MMMMVFDHRKSRSLDSIALEDEALVWALGEPELVADPLVYGG